MQPMIVFFLRHLTCVTTFDVIRIFAKALVYKTLNIRNDIKEDATFLSDLHKLWNVVLTLYLYTCFQQAFHS